jgi:hypothetical protein
VIGPAPLTPFKRFAQVASASIPKAVRAPIPVTTTLPDGLNRSRWNLPKNREYLGVGHYSTIEERLIIGGSLPLESAAGNVQIDCFVPEVDLTTRLFLNVAHRITESL